MSGIAGIINRDGCPVEQEQLSILENGIANRGPDGSSRYLKANAGLLFVNLQTTPEAKFEQQPVEDLETGILLVADARIDNRDDLIGMLGLRSMRNNAPDSLLVLKAFKKWGVNCGQKLVGDYAVTIWDPRQQKLICFRDHIGARPLYYHITDRLIIFSSSLRAILDVRKRNVPIHLGRVAEYLCLRQESNDDTFYADIHRLQPGSVFQVGPKEQKITRFWNLEDCQELSPAGMEGYVEEFRSIFNEAVRSRLRSASPVGCNLSGGLDSSSVLCTAADILGDERELSSFAFNFYKLPRDQLKHIDEKEYQDAVVREKGVDHVIVSGDDYKPFENLEDHVRNFGEPFFFPHLYLNEKLWRAAEKRCIRVMLDGHDGDSVVSHGNEYLQQLARNCRLISLYRNLAALGRVHGIERKRLIKRYVYYPYCRAPFAYFYKYLKWKMSPLESVNPVLNRDFIMEYRLYKHYRPENYTLQGARAYHYGRLTNVLLTSAFENINAFSSLHHIEGRSPFMDRRLMEFCYRLPPNAKLNNGWGRYILRKAMAGVVPDKVRWRPGKSSLTPGFVSNLLKHQKFIESVVYDLSPSLMEWVDGVELKRQWCAFLKDPFGCPSQFHLNIYNAVMMYVWVCTLKK